MIVTAARRSIECADGYRLRYLAWRRPGAARATLVLLNGIMSHSAWWEPLVAPLLDGGLAVVGADRRGTGLNEEARGDAPSARLLVDDVARIVAAERSDGAAVHLAGWCWGAVLAVNVAAAHESGLASLVLLAPGLYPTETLTTRMKDIEVLARSSPPALACLESPIAEPMFTTGPYLENFIQRDPLRTRRFSPRFHDVMAKLGMGAALRLGQLRLPILLVLADADEATDNARTLHAFERVTRAPVSIEHVPGSHGLQFDAPERLGSLLASWTAGVASPP